MVLAEDQVQLVGTSRDLLMGAGTRFDTQSAFNPFTTSVRAPQGGDRPYTHGSWVGAEWMDARVVPIRVIANGTNRDVPTTRAAIQDMQAAFVAVGATGEDIELRFRLKGDPDEYVLFGRPRGVEPDLSTIGLGYVYASTAFVAADPRIYSGTLTTQATGLPLQQGGLVLSAAPASTRLRLTGASGAYASTPDTAALDITGDFEIEVDLGPDVWANGATQGLASKYNGTGNQRSYGLWLSSTGQLQVVWSTDGTSAGRTIVSSATPVPVTAAGVRGSLDVNNGAAGKTITFSYRFTDTGPWIQFDQQTTAGTTSVFSGSALLEVGAHSGGTADRFTGTVRGVRVRSVIGGTIVANPDFTAQTVGVSSFADATGKTWTVNGAAQLTAGGTFRGGLTLPFTVPGVLNGGFLDLVNSGTADAGMTVRIDGPAVEPRLILRRPDGSVQSVRFFITLAAGQWLEIDSTRRLALLNGLASSNQRGNASWDLDPYPLPPGVNTLRFLSGEYSAASQLTASHRSAWW